MDDYKKIPFDDPDLCVPDLDDFDQMKEFFLDCAAEYFRYLSSDDMEKMLAALGKRVDVLATPTDDVFISVSPDAVLRQYPDITIDEAIQIRDNACENIWESGGQSDLDEIVWDQIGAEYKSIKSDSHRGLSDVKDAKAKQAVHVNDDRKNDAVALDMQEKELPRYGGTRFPPALAALSMDIIIPSSYICKMKAEINPKLSDCEREHNSLNRTMHIKVADSRRNRLAQDRDKPRNITPRYDDDSHDSQ